MDNDNLTVEIRLFAGAAQLAGSQTIRTTVPIGSHLPMVVEQLLAEVPELTRLADVSRWAVGTSFVTEKFQFTDSTCLAMIPPVSGG